MEKTLLLDCYTVHCTLCLFNDNVLKFSQSVEDNDAIWVTAGTLNPPSKKHSIATFELQLIINEIYIT
jgi:hypothetical protein